MKRILALLLSLTMLMSLLIVPANAAGEDVVLKITPDKTSINTATAQDVTYTISIEVKDSSVKIGGIQFTLDAPSGMTIPTTLNADNYQINSSELKLAKDEYENVTGGIFETFGYTKETYTFLAAGTTEDRNLNKNVQVMKIKVSVAENTTGSLNFTAKDVEFAKVDGGAEKWTYRIDTTPVTITKAPISDASKITATVGTPMKGVALDTSVDLGGATAYTGTVKWYVGETEATETTAKANTEYTAKITLTAKDGESFAESLNGKNTNDAYEIRVVNAGELELTQTFVATEPATLTGILIPELTVAVPTAKPNETQTKSTPIAVSGVYDDPNIDQTVAATLEIVGTAPTGVTLEGNTLKVTNKASAGKVRVLATFEGKHDNKEITITKADPTATAIVATAPAEGTNITIPNGGTNTSGNCSYKVYDQYGAEMTGTTATWKMDPETVTGVTFIPANGSISVNNTATTSTVKLYAESGGVKSNEITFNISRETSQVTSVRVDAPEYIMNVPKVTKPGTTSQATQQFNAAKVLDQYGQEMTGKTVTWNVADDTGNSVTGVSIDNNGLLTVTNKAPAITVYVTATCSGIVSNKSKVTINKDVAKATLVEICNQVGEAPKTRLLIPAATFTNSEAYTAKVYDQYGVYMPGEMVDWELVPATVAGVELDTTTSTGNAILKVNSTAISGTTFKLKATTATLGTSGVKEQDITVQKKTNVSDKINFNDGSLTYNGNGQKYEKASISGITAGDNPKWTYTYAIKSGGTGMLDTATGLPKIVGTYTVTATYEDSSNIGSKSATLKITPREVAIPAPDTTVYTYDGTAKTYQIPASADYTVNHATQTNANETGYTVTVALTDENNTIWSDGNTIVKHYTFKIMRATPTGEPAYTKITTSGKTLEDASLTKGTITPDGTIKWNDAKTTVVEANKSYGWTFTPTDTANYNPLTGTIKLWNKSTSSGGYYYAPTAAVVPDMPMLYRGCTGDAVKTLQDKLNALGYNSGNVDGIFGAKTYAAVTAFQKANSLGVDGIVGKLTWGKLYGISPAMPVETTTVVGRPMVSYGSRGDAVRKLQELLNALGYDCGSVDGIFGSKTKAAVLAFQKANGLGVDGIVGPLTWGKLV